MTGTSCDALDAACVSFSPQGWTLEEFFTSPYPAALRKRVLAIQEPQTRVSLAEILELERDLGAWYGQTLGRMAQKAGGVDAIANHGQTLAHHPAPQGRGTTLQAGTAARIAQASGLTVVSDFRSGDMAAGGQGAPLVPLFHSAIASGLAPVERGVSIHNIGGISNLTYLGPNDQILAFDTGPGNAWIDLAAAVASSGRLKMDRNGALARKGQPDLAAVDEILKHPFFKKPFPKSTGRDDFPFELLLTRTRSRGADLVATATLITIESIAHAYRQLKVGTRKRPLDRLLVCGGGARNPVLMEGLAVVLPGTRVGSLEECGMDPQTLEAQAFAFFGFCALFGNPIGGSWTGARGYAPPASITPGRNWPELLDKLSRFH